MKKKRILHTPPEEFKKAAEFQAKNKNSSREYYAAIRREKIRNMKMPAHHPPQPKVVYFGMGCPYYETEEEFQARLAKTEEKERRKEARLALELKRRQDLRAKLNITDEECNDIPHFEERLRDFDEQSITRTTPIHDILSRLDENQLPP